MQLLENTCQYSSLRNNLLSWKRPRSEAFITGTDKLSIHTAVTMRLQLGTTCLDAGIGFIGSEESLDTFAAVLDLRHARG